MPIASQVNQSAQAPTTSRNFRAMVGAVLQWNPDLPVSQAKMFINNAYRRVIDDRNWYGLMVRGVLAVPAQYNTGQVSVVPGSETVTGAGTAFTAGMKGMTFRIGRTTPQMLVADVPDATHLTLEMAWPDIAYASSGYQLYQNIVSFGPRIRYVVACLNLRQGWRMRLNMPQDVINSSDPWRTTFNQTWLLASLAQDAGGVSGTAGAALYELYPPPTSAQAFPYVAYQIPPDMTLDADFPYAFIRSDVIEYSAIADALRWRKQSKYYDPQTAMVYEQKFSSELSKMRDMDDGLAIKSLLWEWEKYPVAGGFGSEWAQGRPDISVGN